MNKNIAVTGATKGIGRSVAEVFASEGFNVVFCARGVQDLESMERDLRERHPDRKFSGVVCDVSSRPEVESFAKHVMGFCGTPDVLVNNAGIFIPGQISNEEEGAFEKIMAVNLNSAYHLTRSLIGGMVARKSGHVFNLCSTASITPYINGGSYCISKYALYGMTKVLREEMKEHRVKVTAVLPGATYTDSWRESGLPPARFINPDEVARAIFEAWNTSPGTVIEELLIRPLLGDIT